MLACPRSARMPPPGLPMLPSSSWMIAPARMYCAPTECCVQPTLYTSAVVRSRPERNAQPATGHSPSSDVVSMMRPSATQAAP